MTAAAIAFGIALAASLGLVVPGVVALRWEQVAEVIRCLLRVEQP